MIAFLGYCAFDRNKYGNVIKMKEEKKKKITDSQQTSLAGFAPLPRRHTLKSATYFA